MNVTQKQLESAIENTIRSDLKLAALPTHEPVREYLLGHARGALSAIMLTGLIESNRYRELDAEIESANRSLLSPSGGGDGNIAAALPLTV